MSAPKSTRSFCPKAIRNIAPIGRHGSGKTTLAHVWTVTTDPYTGKLAMLRVLQGRLEGTTSFAAGR